MSNQAKMLLPTWTKEALLRDLFSDKVLLRQLENRITDGLKARSSKVKADFFINRSPPSLAVVVIPALLARKRLSTKRIVDEFEKYCSKQPNAFEYKTEWLHNYFLATYLDLFSNLVRVCPIYSGFETFCFIAKGNIRHFLELCSKAFAALDQSNEEFSTVTLQAEAARQVAISLLPEVRSFGPLGNDLHTFLHRLGQLFALSQRRISQSEPERTHFAIRDGEESIDDRCKRLLSEAVKWSVLFEEKETKTKSKETPRAVDYVLNPIYAPYFHISYRKGRKLDLSASDFTILATGSAEEYKTRLYARLSREWDIARLDAPELSIPWAEETEESA